MNREQLLQDIIQLPPAAQREALDFVDFLKSRYGHGHPVRETVGAPPALENESFIGMWRDRHDRDVSGAWRSRGTHSMPDTRGRPVFNIADVDCIDIPSREIRNARR